MDPSSETSVRANCTRRDFVKATAIVAGGAVPLGVVATSAYGAGSDELKAGLIGCGGRGTGAAFNILQASDQVRLVALADVFRDRLDGCRNMLTSDDHSNRDQVQIDDDRCYVGFDSYQKLVNSDVDLVLLATPPHFRSIHFEAAINAGKHVFMEKPVAVDPTGIRKVIASAAQADRNNLTVVAGTQRRHEARYLALMQRIHGGEIGDIISARCYWNQGGLWVKEQQPAWSDMEWQIRNWLYFTWLSGDHIVEQHVHNLDVCNWAIGSHPIKCAGMGGREVRTAPKYGHVFDHFAIEYEYPNGVVMHSYCRQIDGCTGQVAEAIHGSTGRTWSDSGRAEILGQRPWRFDATNPNPYVVEHKDLIASITNDGPHLNEAKRVAESTLTAIMGRLSAYTGQGITWDKALNSQLDLSPPAYEFSSLPTPEVAVPGRTPFI
ncbi:MAG: Gfo/Idh/MocA family oxidoreductase [Phycisphaerales bacterium]